MTATDYQNIIDAATWAFIARSGASYPKDTASRTIADQRLIYDAMCRSFHYGYPAGVVACDDVFAGVPCRVYNGVKPTVIYLHGGGYVVGGLQSHDDICAEICARSGYRVISVDYRLAPEHLHPAAYDDAMAVARMVAKDSPYIIAGDSAGGNLAAAVARSLRHEAPPLGLLLIYAALGGKMGRGSYLAHADAPMLTVAEMGFYAGIRHKAGVPPGKDPTAAPLDEVDLADMPPTFAFSAECDPVADDGRDYCARIAAAGGQATWRLEPGLVHGYLRARHSVPRAAESFDRIITAIKTLGARP